MTSRARFTIAVFAALLVPVALVIGSDVYDKLAHKGKAAAPANTAIYDGNFSA